MLLPVILSGGAGTRLWPASRELNPKPFLRPDGGLSLLQQTFERARHLPGAREVLTVTHREFYFRTADEYQEVNPDHLPTRYILEPFGRNTAPAVALAALEVQAVHGDDATLLILPADHVIRDPEAFRLAVVRAKELAAEGLLVCFGIRPDHPETGFGYLETDQERVLRFVEKPDLETARSYLARGNFLWNAGMFCFTAGAILREFTLHAPDLLAAAQAASLAGRRSEGVDRQQLELGSEEFRTLPDISIDYAILEKSSRVAVVPCDPGWSDVGNWDAMSALHTPDVHGNTVHGTALLHNAVDCHVESPDRVTALVGVRDLIVVDTPDALLVAQRDAAQDVRHIVARLRMDGQQSYLLHRTVHRPWGNYTVLEEQASYKMKRVVVAPGRTLSLQMHHHRSEHWVVVEGAARVTNGEEVFMLFPSQSTYIPAGTRHRLENPGVVDLAIIEVQTGTYLGEDDIVRFEDRYGRV
jgi:mannose-1-phosphate guanylyltransferase